MITQATPLTPLEAIPEYYAMGWSLVPMTTTGRKQPALASWTEWQRQRMSPADLRPFWTERPWLNIGAVTGAISGICVLDADGKCALGLLKAHGVSLPKTRTHRSPHGWHFFYRYNPAFKTDAKLLEAGDECSCTRDGEPKKCAIDVRSDKGCIMLPPSVFNGKPYTVAYEYEIAEWPDPPDFLCHQKKDTAPRQRRISPTLYASTPYGRIKAKVSVSEVAAVLGVRLERVADKERGLCPLHSENTASFYIWPEQQEGSGSWYCFGCSQGGDVITLLELSGRLEMFTEATR